ncbi:hypothetical protein LCR01_00400 [Companilactobacillus crustorum]|uniref:DUF3923 domain-containing protein n=2 Tax=Companilactobacillus TaxID=2767879 RepID=A0A2P4R493_9LACO|nr:DUF3923 family protein [Companilactobacillus crustorum]GEO75597.1 hypothetical protein LCR01_00400 [Companilactobacillus crustorum]HCD08392.1 DUF3923 domain-containing protein [Lactobacillus sp.]
MKTWRIINVIWLLLFLVAIFWIMVRKTDGTGLVQTPQLRMVTLLILGIFLVLVIGCQLLALYLIKKHKEK